MLTKGDLENQKFHTQAPEEVLELLRTTLSGLSASEAAQRLGHFGENALEEGRKKTLIIKFLEQFKELMVLILLVASVVSGAMGEWTDTAIILAVVIINAVLGVAQESKAEKALEALKKMAAPSIKLKREGILVQVPTSQAVPGDILVVEAGDLVPADARLIEIASLKSEESALTGESVPVEKHIGLLEDAEAFIGDRKNMIYSGSSITYGRGVAVITATGMDTEVGHIAQQLTSDMDSTTPLQKKMTELSKVLSVGVVIVATGTFVVGVLRGRPMMDMFMTAISLAVAAIPEGLPAVITIVLAIGVQKMAKRNAIIRKLSAVETLGSTQIICSDKTGTLTQNRMTVSALYADQVVLSAEEADPEIQSVRRLIEAISLCNDSRKAAEDHPDPYLGDPTETALVVFADLKGIEKHPLEQAQPRVHELPFDSGRKLMSTVHDSGQRIRMATKGAPDVLLMRCTHYLQQGEVLPMTESVRTEIFKVNSAMASQALRVLAVAERWFDDLPEMLKPDEDEVALTFLGLVGMIDPPRPEARAAVELCSSAGIRPVMITGDHKDTAAAIAKALNILQHEEGIITGSELNDMSDDVFESNIERYSVYARVSPEHKVRIVDAWQKQGKIVAMTGDGVNDAPAIRSADIGIGMGITGTDVSKGVSNMVLSDDNFATIVSAVEEGRKIYANIRKCVQFLLSCNLGEIVAIFLGTLMGWTVLLPIHILWVNLITDTLPALALGMEKAEKDVMNTPPRDAKASFFSDGVGHSILFRGFFLGLITLSTYWYGETHYNHQVAMTMAFATLGLIQLAQSINTRSNDKSVFKIGFFSNPYLNGAILISAFLQVSIIVIPGLNNLFKVVSLSPGQWGVVLMASFSIIPVAEVIKLFLNLKGKKTNPKT
jgi:Ca2+-transporting ATPase